ncbi:hypothetical protein DdX_18796 [Ditylenchus destructor]|uniref:Uncharacterized protein n=1 Tax=Ditylenchus destructor TaxID=166010 RepID=A0AAD4MNU0_9BILA|nr:hypothetical protein DdX_18796 [Ditylenchus destructor]
MSSLGFTSEEIKRALERALNKSGISLERMENYKLYLLNNISRFADEMIQRTKENEVYTSQPACFPSALPPLCAER